MLGILHHYERPPHLAPSSHMPQPRIKPHGSLAWLTRLMDEFDDGMLLVVDPNVAVHLNHAARVALDASHPLQLLGCEPRVQQAHDVLGLHDALADAQRGLRRQLTLHAGGASVAITALPLGPLHGGSRAALGMLGNGPLMSHTDLHSIR